MASFSLGKRGQRNHVTVLSTPYREAWGKWRQTILEDTQQKEKI